MMLKLCNLQGDQNSKLQFQNSIKKKENTDQNDANQNGIFLKKGENIWHKEKK